MVMDFVVTSQMAFLRCVKQNASICYVSKSPTQLYCVLLEETGSFRAH